MGHAVIAAWLVLGAVGQHGRSAGVTGLNATGSSDWAGCWQVVVRSGSSSASRGIGMLLWWHWARLFSQVLVSIGVSWQVSYVISDYLDFDSLDHFEIRHEAQSLEMLIALISCISTT